MSTQTIEKIRQEEEAAEKLIAQAREKARYAKEELEQKFQAEFDRLSETLGDERREASERVQVEVSDWKDQMVDKLKKDITAVTKGADEKVKRAKDVVVKKFNAYVSQ